MTEAGKPISRVAGHAGAPSQTRPQVARMRGTTGNNGSRPGKQAGMAATAALATAGKPLKFPKFPQQPCKNGALAGCRRRQAPIWQIARDSGRRAVTLRGVRFRPQRLQYQCFTRSGLMAPIELRQTGPRPLPQSPSCPGNRATAFSEVPCSAISLTTIPSHA